MLTTSIVLSMPKHSILPTDFGSRSPCSTSKGHEPASQQEPPAVVEAVLAPARAMFGDNSLSHQVEFIWSCSYTTSCPDLACNQHGWANALQKQCFPSLFIMQKCKGLTQSTLRKHYRFNSCYIPQTHSII